MSATAIWQKLEHSRIFLSVFLFAILFAGGCQWFRAKIPSLNDPEKQVDQYEFEQEVSKGTVSLETRAIQLKTDTEEFAKRVQLARDELYRRQGMIDATIGLLKTTIGTAVPGAGGGLLDAVFGLIAGGAVIQAKVNANAARKAKGGKE